MPNRWRGRGTVLVLAIALALVAVAGALGAATARSSTALTVTAPDGAVLAHVALPEDGTFSLRYRNSLYGTLAEERFVVTPDGELRLVELAADQLAVLEEYYAIQRAATPDVGGRRSWRAEPAHVPVLRTLRIAATDLGERTLLVDGAEPIELWQLAGDDDPTVILEADDR